MKKLEINYQKLILDPEQAIVGRQYFCGTGSVTIKKSIKRDTPVTLLRIYKDRDYPFRVSNGQDYSILYEVDEKDREDAISNKNEEVAFEVKETIDILRQQLKEEINLGLNKDIVKDLLDNDSLRVDKFKINTECQRELFAYSSPKVLKDFISISSDRQALTIEIDQECGQLSSFSEINIPLRYANISKLSIDENTTKIDFLLREKDMNFALTLIKVEKADSEF